MLKVIISGGGTGGHVFPAIAIARALKEKVITQSRRDVILVTKIILVR